MLCERTPFRIPRDLRAALRGITNKRDLPLSTLVEEQLGRFLDSIGEGRFEKNDLRKPTGELGVTSVFLSTELKRRAKAFCVKSKVSIGALIRHVLYIYLEREVLPPEKNNRHGK